VFTISASLSVGELLCRQVVQLPLVPPPSDRASRRKWLITWMSASYAKRGITLIASAWATMHHRHSLCDVCA